MANGFYDDVVFPETISLAAFSGKINRKTRRFSVQNGVESRIALWGASLRTYDAGIVVRPLREYEQIRALYEVVDGPTFGFNLKDASECVVRAPGDVVQGAFLPLSATVFVFQKRYALGTRSVYRGIVKLVPGTVRVYARASATSAWYVADAASYAITSASGLLTTQTGFDPNNLSWAGFFYTPVRFDNDSLDWTANANQAGLLIESPSIPLSEMRWPGFPVRDPDNGMYSGGIVSPPPPAQGTATTVTSTGPTSVEVGSPATFTFRVDGTLASPRVVSPHAFPGGQGSWNPPSLTFVSGYEAPTSEYTATTAGTYTLTRTNDGGLANGSNLSLTVVAAPSLTLAPASMSGGVGVASGDFTVGSNGPLPLATVVTPHSTGAGGAIVPATLTIGPGSTSPTATFKRTAAAAGDESITLTNDRGIANPPAAVYHVSELPTSLSLSPSTMTTQAGVLSGAFTAALDRPAVSAITVALHSSGSGGTFTSGSGPYASVVTSITFQPGVQAIEFKRTPDGAAPAGTESISLTNDAGLSNPPPATLTVTASAPAPAPAPAETAMTSGDPQPLGGQNGMTSGQTVGYYIDVAAGSAQLEVKGVGMNGSVDYDVFIRFGAAPTATTYDRTFEVNGRANVTENIPSPAAGRWHFLVRANTTFTGAVLVATVS